MRKRFFVLVFVAILILLILVDVMALDRVLTRDFTSMFVKDGMNMSLVTALIGMPEADIGSGAVVHAYPMPFNSCFLVTYGLDNTTVINTVDPSPSYPLRGFWLPAVLAAVAVLEALIYLVVNKRSRR